MKVKIRGIQLNHLLVGSGGAGLSFIWAHIVTPMISGQARDAGIGQ
jgi:hypothetical protein